MLSDPSTCRIGIGDSPNNHFKAVGYSNQLVQVWNDRNYPAYPPAHDLFPGLVFIDKHVQPSHDQCLNNLMHTYYGRIEPLVTLRNITATFQTGDMHIAVYDFDNGFMYAANAGPADANGNAVSAYDRQFMRFNMTQLWATALSDY